MCIKIIIQENVPNTQFVIMPTAFPIFQRSILFQFFNWSSGFQVRVVNIILLVHVNNNIFVK
jgi:hypothetical protein